MKGARESKRAKKKKAREARELYPPLLNGTIALAGLGDRESTQLYLRMLPKMKSTRTSPPNSVGN
jgi:hypothetical protein